MLPLRFTLCVGAVLALAAPGAAFDIQAGMHGMPWGSSVAGQTHLTRVRDAGPLSYYVNPQTLYSLANQPVPGVVYGFYRQQFFATYIRLNTPDQFYHMERQFTARYGAPRVTVDSTGRLTVYRWQDERVKIKLKLREPGGDMKLGIYYMPLTAHLDEAQLDEAPPEAFTPRPPPPADRPPKPAPLLE